MFGSCGADGCFLSPDSSAVIGELSPLRGKTVLVELGTGPECTDALLEFV